VTLDLLLQLLVFGLSNGAVLALNALGVTIAYSTVRTLNLAHGDVFALTSVLVASLITGLGVRRDWPPALLAGALVALFVVAVLCGALLNVLIERAAFRPFRGRSRLSPLIATLGLSFILYQGALIWRKLLPSWIPGDHRSVPGLPEVPVDNVPDLLPGGALAFGHVTVRFHDAFVLAVAVLCALGVSWLLRRTITGRGIRACAQNPELAQVLGVDLDATIARSFALGGGLAGVAAFVFVLYYTRPFGQHGAESGLLAFTAALLGGVGSPLGALASSLLLGAGAALSDYTLAAQWTPVLMQALLVGVLVLRPAGLAAGDAAPEALQPFNRREHGARGGFSILPPAAAAAISKYTLRPLRFNPAAVAPYLLALTALLLPLVLGLRAQTLAAALGVFVLLALGLNVSLGLAGVLDLGFAASYGIGAYAAGILINRGAAPGAWLPQPLDFGVVLAASIAAAGLFGALKGALAGRLTSDTLAPATLALGLLVQQAALNLEGLTGGVGGLAALPLPRVLGVLLAQPAAQYVLVFALAALAALAGARVLHSRPGRAWRAGAADEVAAAASGVHVARERLLALALGSALAGAAGALSASLSGYVAPDMLDFQTSAMALAMVVLGGAGNVPGVIAGTLLIAGYDRVLIPQAGAWLAQSGLLDLRGTSALNFGLVLYLTVLLRRRGSMTWARRLLRKAGT
jgi:branched-chain amino acid transport system permease protein